MEEIPKEEEELGQLDAAVESLMPHLWQNLLNTQS